MVRMGRKLEKDFKNFKVRRIINIEQINYCDYLNPIQPKDVYIVSL